MKATANFLSAFFAFIAAYLWWRSASVRVSADDKTSADALSMIYRDAKGQVDLVGTTKRASEWNAWAAKAAAMAALLQGVGLLIPD